MTQMSFSMKDLSSEMMVDIIFKDVEDIPAYKFDFPVMLISLVVFIIIYEILMFAYSEKIKKDFKAHGHKTSLLFHLRTPAFLSETKHQSSRIKHRQSKRWYMPVLFHTQASVRKDR